MAPDGSGFRPEQTKPKKKRGVSLFGKKTSSEEPKLTEGQRQILARHRSMLETLARRTLKKAGRDEGEALAIVAEMLKPASKIEVEEARLIKRIEQYGYEGNPTRAAIELMQMEVEEHIQAREERPALAIPDEPPAPVKGKKKDQKPKKDPNQGKIDKAIERDLEKAKRRAAGKTKDDPLAKTLSQIQDDYNSGDQRRIARANARLNEIQKLIPLSKEEARKEFSDNAELADSAELLRARYKTRAERDQVMAKLVRTAGEMWKSRKQKNIETLERDIIQQLVLEINKDLIAKGTGTLSPIDTATGLSSAAKVVVPLRALLVFSETTTLSGLFTFFAQTLMDTTFSSSFEELAGDSKNLAVYLLCVLGAAALAPIIELLKDKAAFEPITNMVYRARRKELKAKDSGVPVKKTPLSKNVLKALALVGSVAGVTVATQGPQTYMAGLMLGHGAETGNFARDTDTATASAQEQAERVISLREQMRDDRGELVFDEEGAPVYEPFGGNLPEEVREVQDNLTETCSRIVSSEISGSTGGDTGGTGQADYGPAAALKDYLCFGALVNQPAHITGTFEASIERAQALRSNFRYQRFNADGTPMRGDMIVRNGVPQLGLDGEPQYEPVYVDIELRPGQSVSEWFGERYAAFEERGHTILTRWMDQANLTLEQKEQILRDFSAYGMKRSLMTRGLIVIANGFNNNVEEMVALMEELQLAYNEEVVQPTQGLTASLAGALRTVSAGDRGVAVPVEALEFDITDLQNLTAPESLDPTKPEGLARLFQNGPLSSKLIFLSFIALILGGAGGIATLSAMKGRRQADIAHIQEKDIFGVNSFKEGQEYITAETISKHIEAYLKMEDGLFTAESLKQFLPFEGDMNWFQCDPEYMLFMMRLAGEARGIDFKQRGAWAQIMGEKYMEAVANMRNASVTAPEFVMLADMTARYRDKEVLLQEMFKEILPGYFELMFLSQELTRLQNEGKDETSPEIQLLSIEFFNVFTEMVIEHLETRVRYAQTKLAYYNEAYKDLATKGEWSDGGIEGFADLPTVSYNFFNSANISKDDEDAIEAIRDLGYRKAIISEIETERTREQQVLDQAKGFLAKIDAEAEKRIARRNTTFLDRLTRLRATLDRSTAVVTNDGNENTEQYTTRGGLERVVREQSQAKIQGKLRRMRAQRSESTTEYPIRTQLETAAITLERADAEGLGSEWSFFINDPRLGKYTCKANPVLRPAGYKGAIAEYYAVVFTVTERDKGAKAPTLYEGEMPIELLFAKQLSPDDVARELGKWIRGHQEEISLNVKLFAVKQSISELEEEVAVPEETPLTGAKAAPALKKLLTETLPRARRQNILETIKSKTGYAEQEFVSATQKPPSSARVTVVRQNYPRQYAERYIRPLQSVWTIEDDIDKLKANTGRVYDSQYSRIEKVTTALAERKRALRGLGFELAYISPRKGTSGRIRMRKNGLLEVLVARSKRKTVQVSLRKLEAVVFDPANSDDRKLKTALKGLFSNKGSRDDREEDRTETTREAA